MRCGYASVWAVVTSLVTPSALAHDDGGSSSHSGCRYSIAYTAPTSCPSAATLRRRLSDAFDVVSGTMSSCKECVRGIVIRPAADQRAGYEMSLTGLESTTVRRHSCDELVELATHAVEASDLPEPVCEPLPLRVGVSGSALVDWPNLEPLWTAELRASLTMGQWQVTPFGVWLAPATVENQLAGSRFSTLEVSGYGAGLDACWRAWRSSEFASNERSVQLCGLGAWRRLEVLPIGGDFASLAPADSWTAGLGVLLSWQATSNLRLEAAPSLTTALVPARTAFDAPEDRIHSRGGLEATLRVGFSWGFSRSTTPNGTEALRSAEASRAEAPSAPRASRALRRTSARQKTSAQRF